MNQDQDEAVAAAGLTLAREAAVAGLENAAGWFQEADEIRQLPAFRAFAELLQLSPDASRFESQETLESLAVAWARQAAYSEDPTRIWPTFWREVCDADWHYVVMANLHNFDADSEEIPFGDGLSVRSRSLSGLAKSTGWPPDLLRQTLGIDWRDSLGGAGSFVLMHESDEPKTRSMPSSNSVSHAGPVARLLLALRLNGHGEVGVGRLYSQRRTSFPVFPGISSSGFPSMGGRGSGMLFVTDRDKSSVDSLYRALAAFDVSRTAAVDALGVALARFDSACSRTWVSQTDRVLDDMIGFEALVGELGAELSYSIALRVSGLLAATDAERVRLFKDLRAFYAVRSAVVHGRKLNGPQEGLIAREPELRDLLRRLLRGYLHLHGTRGYSSNKRFRERLDELLLETSEAATLRTAMAIGQTAPADPATTKMTPQWTDQERSQSTIMAGGQVVTDNRPVES